MRLTPNVLGSESKWRNGFVLIALLGAIACAGPPGKEGPQGPPGLPPDAGSTPDAGPAAALTAETCVICHGSGQLADDIPLHKAAAANALARGFATISSVTIPTSSPIKPTVAFTVKDAATSGNPVTGLTSFAFTVAQLVPAASGGISNWRAVINRNYNAASDPSIGGQTESSLPTAAFPAAAQAACTESPAGTYTCVLGDDLSVIQPLNSNYGVVTNAFDPSLPTRIGLQSSAPTPGSAATIISFTSPPWPSPPPATITVQPTPPFNATFDLHTYDTAVTVADPDPRGLVATAACNQCHQRLAAHGGRRLDVPFCVTCHNANSFDNLLPTAQRNAPDPYNGTVDFKRVLHKVHMGKNLPSVLAGGKFTFHGVDFSDVSFPQMSSNSTSDPGNCTACHVLTSANEDDPANNWRNKPSRVACAACHDDIIFENTQTPPAGFTLHSGGPQADDNRCAECHTSDPAAEDVDAPVSTVHTGLRALQDDLSAKYQFNIVSVASGAPGQKPVVTFSVTDPNNAGAAYTLAEPAWTQTATGASRLAIDIVWSTNAVTSAADTNYTNQGSGANPGQPVTIDALVNKVAGTAAGTFTVTSTVAIPANAVGVGQVVMEGHPADTTVTPNTRIPVKSATKTFAITGTATTARRQVVNIDKCNVCHGNLSLHGNNRTGSIEACVSCHNANATDINRRPTTGATLDNKAEESIDFKKLIHGIHGAGFNKNGPVIYGFGGTPNDFRKASFPGNDACRNNPSFCLVNNCEICHNAGTYSAAFAPANGTTTSTETLADPSTYLRTTKITATCSACHAAKLFTDHMQQNGGKFDVTQTQIDASQ
jgi:OmcA/MtrC family decaheme c-type cytochrome